MMNPKNRSISNRNKQLAKARELEQSHDLTGALSIYRQLLEHHPEDSEILKHLARLHEALREWDRLIEITKRQIDLVSSRKLRANLLFRLGSLYERHLENEQMAADSYHRAITVYDRCLPALHGLRDLYQSQGKPERVIDCLKQELRVWDKNQEKASVLTRIAVCRWKDQNQAERALQHLDEALRISPGYMPALQLKVDISIAQKAWDEAAPLIQALSTDLLSLTPSQQIDLFVRRALVTYHLDRKDEAINNLKLVLDVDPTHAEGISLLFRFLQDNLDLESHHDFLQDLRVILRKRDDSQSLSQLSQLLGQSAARKGQISLAKAHFQEALQQSPDNINALELLVKVLIRLRNFDLAESVLLTFLEASKDDVEQAAKLLLSEIYMDHLNEQEKSLSLALEAVAYNASSRKGYQLIAQASGLKENWPMARKAMESLVDLDTQAGSVVSREARAENLFYLGRIFEIGFQEDEEALSCYTLACQSDPGNFLPFIAAAALLSKNASYERIDKLSEKFTKMVPAERAVEFRDVMKRLHASIQLKRGNPSEALNRLLPIDSKHPVEWERQQMAIDEILSVYPTVKNGDEGAIIEALLPRSFSTAELERLQRLYRHLQIPNSESLFKQVLAVINNEKTGERYTFSPDVTLIPQSIDEQDPSASDEDLTATLRLLGKLKRHRDDLIMALSKSHLQEIQYHCKSQVSSAEDLELLNNLEKAIDSVVSNKGFNCRWYWRVHGGVKLYYAPGSTPTVHLQISSPVNPEEVRFLLGHATYFIHSGLDLPAAATQAELFCALNDVSGPNGKASGTTAQPEFKTKNHNSTRGSTPLSRTDFQREMDHLERTGLKAADRFGLLLCGDVKEAIQCIFRIETGHPIPLPRRDTCDITESERASSLVRYALTPGYISKWNKAYCLS